jgi:hypothetical protein
MTPTINDQLFGPLDRKYCLYFYYLSIFNLILLVFLVISSLYIIMTSKNSGVFGFQMIFAVLTYAIFYFQNRLMYSMCVNSL